MNLKLAVATIVAAAVIWNFIPEGTAASLKVAAENERPHTVSVFTSNPRAYHRKVVRAEGLISSQVKTKRFKGKGYTVFKMKDPGGSETAMRVYLKGNHNAALNKGDRVRVRGRFYEKRKYLFIPLKNVLKGRDFEVVVP